MTKKNRVHLRTGIKCRQCGTLVPYQEYVWWEKGRGNRCMECGPHTPLPDMPEEPKPKPRPAKKPRPLPTSSDKPASRKDSDGVYRYEFDSVGDAIKVAMTDYAQTPQGLKTLQETCKRYDIDGKGDEWTNYYNRQMMLDAMGNPPKHLLVAVDKMREHLIDTVTTPTVPRRKVRRGQEFGDEIDVDRFTAKDPYCWDRNERELQEKRVVWVGVNLSCNASQRPKELLYRGAAALALADVLTNRGFNVGIAAFDSTSRPTNAVDNSVVKLVIKKPEMPMDVASASFAMAEIAFFRIVCAIGFTRLMPGDASRNLGIAEMLPEADQKQMDFFVENNVRSEEAAAEWLKNQIGGNDNEW